MDDLDRCKKCITPWMCRVLRKENARLKSNIEKAMRFIEAAEDMKTISLNTAKCLKELLKEKEK